MTQEEPGPVARAKAASTPSSTSPVLPRALASPTGLEGMHRRRPREVLLVRLCSATPARSNCHLQAEDPQSEYMAFTWGSQPQTLPVSAPDTSDQRRGLAQTGHARGALKRQSSERWEKSCRAQVTTPRIPQLFNPGSS